MSYKSLVAIMAGFLALTAPVRAGDLVFVNAGGGAGSLGVAGIASLNVVHDKWTYGMRVSAVDEFAIFGPSPSKSDTDFAMLFGRASRGTRGLHWASVGVAHVNTVGRGRLLSSGWLFGGGTYERLERHTIGLPIDVASMWTFKYGGVGVRAFGNINSANSFAGLALAFQVGKLR